jgi:hypothetical protein
MQPGVAQSLTVTAARCVAAAAAAGFLSQAMVGGKELAHYGRVDSGAEIDAAAERELHDRATAVASSRSLIAALQARERSAATGAPTPQLQEAKQQQKQEPRKLSKRAKRKQQKAQTAARAAGAGAGAGAGARAAAGVAPPKGKKRQRAIAVQQEQDAASK